MVAEGHRLRGLQMGEAGHHGCGMIERLLGERALQIGELGIQRVDGVAHIEPEVGRHLVVARARGVQPPGGSADQPGEAGFDIHVDVFQRTLEGEGAGFDL